MDLPQDVLVYSQLLSLSGTQGTLVAVRPEGYFELRLMSKGKLHQVLLPIAQTAIVFAEPEPEITSDIEIER